MNILLVDDHQMVLDGLSVFLNESIFNANVRTSNNGKDALDILLTGTIDIALIDLRLPVMNGFTLLEELEKEESLTPIIVISASKDPNEVKRAIELGAMSFISKSSPGLEIIRTIQEVIKGNVVYSKELLNSSDLGNHKNSNDWATLHNITPRQLEVLRLVSQGNSNQEISEKLYISIATVKTHLNCIFSSLKAKNRSDCVNKAKQLGLD